MRVTRYGDSRLRVGMGTDASGEASVASVAPLVGGPAPDAETILAYLDDLRRQGVRAASTTALSAAEALPFLLAGFEPDERLHLLVRPLDEVSPDPVPGVRLRRARRSDRSAVLDLDRRSFDGFWRLDIDTLRAARAATPTSRFRVALTDGLAGYAIVGLSGPRAFLQRLAVDPVRRRCHIGTALVGDAIGWARRRGTTEMIVNTQERNGPALALYEGLGFRRRPEGLVVLRWSDA